MSWSVLFLPLASIIGFFVGADELLAQSTIVLRDLTRLKNVVVEKFDDSGVTLASKRKLAWSEILQANVGPEQQSAFDQKLKTIGLPLFRLNRRIGNGDWESAGDVAAPLFETLNIDATDSTGIDTAYLVSIATMASRLQQGDRAAAVLPFLRAAALQPKCSRRVLDLVANRRISERDAKLSLSEDILPVWFDKEKIRTCQPELAKFVADQKTPAPGATIYLASMQIETGQIVQAEKLIRDNSQSLWPARDWITLLKARIEMQRQQPVAAVARLRSNANNFTQAATPVALYYSGMCARIDGEATDEARSQAMLNLLRIPALYGSRYEELSAAALFHAAAIAQQRQRPQESEKLLQELSRRYRGTYHENLESKSPQTR